MQLNVHLGQRLLHQLDLSTGLLYQVLPMPQITPQHAHLGSRPERTRQQSVAVQLLQPLAVANIGLASGNVLDVPGIDQQHLQPTTSRI